MSSCSTAGTVEYVFNKVVCAWTVSKHDTCEAVSLFRILSSLSPSTTDSGVIQTVYAYQCTAGAACGTLVKVEYPASVVVNTVIIADIAALTAFTNTIPDVSIACVISDHGIWIPALNASWAVQRCIVGRCNRCGLLPALNPITGRRSRSAMIRIFPMKSSMSSGFI